MSSSLDLRNCLSLSKTVLTHQSLETTPVLAATKTDMTVLIGREHAEVKEKARPEKKRTKKAKHPYQARARRPPLTLNEP